MMNRTIPRLALLAAVAGITVAVALASRGDQAAPSQPPQQPASPEVFPTQGILPKVDTQAAQFLKKHPEFDGRGTVVAIFDTGVDPAAAGLITTPQGDAKFIDFVDATGSGDVDMTAKAKPQEGILKGKSGRELKVDPNWTNPTGEFRVGIVAAYDLFPADDLIARLKEERGRQREPRQRERESQLRLEIAQASESSSPSKKELEARLQVLQELNKNYDDPGPVYDCVLFHDGALWWAVVDTDEDGDLTNETLLTDYDRQPGYATFSDQSRLNFTVHIYDDGDILSLVTPCGDHGTHVAGIVGAYEADRPERNGIAPGCRMISVKIGDTHLAGMETGAGLVRGINAVLQHKCDLVNLSYGEPSTVPNRGRLQSLMNELVREHGVIFVSSAGNSGPALSTVGAPGGTCAGLIGVGAYVSPEMMDVEYTLREKNPATAYTWTSRGPTFDGAWGVDIFAPGGAIAPVPPYTLQPARQMNGTSMASPNACGNIALLLSAMKQQSIPYTNWSVLRAIQNTAHVVADADRFAQGPGLLQVDHAYEHLTKWHRSPGETTEIQVVIPALGDARGIYLREPFQTDRPFEATVLVAPRFPNAASNDAKLEYDLPLKWSADAPWVKVGEHMILPSGGRTLPVRVEPQQLQEGVHAAEVVAIDPHRPGRGPLVRIPVVVVKGTAPTNNQVKWTAATRGASIVRKFIHVPQGATGAELKLRRRDAEAPCMGFLHAVHLVPGQTFEEGEQLQIVRLDGQEEMNVSLPLTGGRTLEVCWGHYWSSQGTATIDFELTFRGLSTGNSMLALPSDGSAVRVDVHSSVARETCRPSGSLTTLRKVLAPSNSGQVRPLPGDRNTLWDGHRTHQRLLTYQFRVEANTKITLHCPELEGFLYDAPVDHFLMTLKNADGRIIAREDIYPEPVRGLPDLFPIPVNEGDYTIELDLRHLDPEQLQRWGDVLLTVDQQLAAPIRVPAYPTRVAAAGTGTTFSSTPLPPGSQTTIWLRFPDGAKTPSGAAAGDLLLGTLQLTADAPRTDHGGDRITLTYTVPPSPASSTGSPSQKGGDYDQAYLDFLIEQISTRSWPKDQELVDRLSEEYRTRNGDQRRLAVARLHVIDNDDREGHLDDVIAAADAVIAAVDQERLAAYFGRRHDPQSDDEKKTDKERQAEKKDLADALYRKGRALAHREQPEVLAKQPIADQQAHDQLFDETFQQLAQWVDTTDPQYALLHIRRHWRQKNYGQALQLLNEKFARAKSKKLHDEKRAELLELLGWDEWKEYQQRWNLRRYPQSDAK